MIAVAEPMDMNEEGAGAPLNFTCCQAWTGDPEILLVVLRQTENRPARRLLPDRSVPRVLTFAAPLRSSKQLPVKIPIVIRPETLLACPAPNDAPSFASSDPPTSVQ